MTRNVISNAPPGRGLRRWKWLVALMLVMLGGGLAYWATTRWNAVPDASEHPWAEATDTPAGPAWFRDVTSGSGIDFTYRNGEEADQFTILESIGGGVAMIDFDGDGLLDLFFTG